VSCVAQDTISPGRRVPSLPETTRRWADRPAIRPYSVVYALSEIDCAIYAMIVPPEEKTSTVATTSSAIAATALTITLATRLDCSSSR
jgi:hypothetical protein